MLNKQIYIIGNWKSNKNREDVQVWFEEISKSGFFTKKINNLEIVVCPTYIHLELAQNLITKYSLNLKLGAQDISPFGDGAFTGEVSAPMLKEYINYVIIGHSERRKNFGEDDQLLSEKANKAKSAGLKTVFCVPDENTFIPEGVDIVAYEPIWAIGTGKSDTPDNACKVIGAVKEKKQKGTVIYGGSVSPENIVSFLSVDNIDGVLLGAASLDPGKFSNMIQSVDLL